MKVTEELDSLRVLALEPIEFVLAPKYLALIAMALVRVHLGDQHSQARLVVRDWIHSRRQLSLALLSLLVECLLRNRGSC
jgi:hypothetical protein